MIVDKQLLGELEALSAFVDPARKLREIFARDSVLEAMCRAHDAEDSSHMGEPSLWVVRERGDFSGSEQDWEEWRAERLAAMRCALQAAGLA